MIKPKYIYMWDNVDKTIQTIESRIDLINRRTDLYDPKFFPKTMMVVHSNLLILLENFWQWKNYMILGMGLYPNVHPWMNDSLSWKVIFLQGGRISRRHFHHLAMNSYPNQKISPWQTTILCIQLNRRIYVIMILYVLCSVVWCLMTSSWV